MQHRLRRPPMEGGERIRRDLPLAEHPLLDLESDFALVSVSPTSEAPYVELVGEAPLPDLVVEGANGTTRVRASRMGGGLDERFRHGRFWEGRFWDRPRWRKHLHVQLVVHVPPNVRAHIRPSAGYIHVEQLAGCQLDIHADAGAIALEDVSGRLTLTTDAGRIDGSGLRGSITASTTAGAIRLELVDLEPGRHKVRTSMGAALIELARGLPVQIETRTAMGSVRVDAPSTRGAAAILDVEAELGAIRVGTSRRAWVAPPMSSETDAQTIYRTNGSPTNDDEAVERILARVADGSLSAHDARELLRSMGWA
jgi:hypothetical protein